MFKKLSAMMMALVLATAMLSLIGTSPAYADDAPAASSAAPGAATTAAPSDPVAPPDASKDAPNPYGFMAVLQKHELIAMITLIILGIMSMGSWYIIVTKVLDQAKIFKQAKEAQEKFWNAGSIEQGTASLSPSSPFRYIAASAAEASEHHGGLLEHIDLNSWVSMSIQRSVETVQSRLQDGLAFLATVGSTAPFVGLFGTVLGIYHALTAIGIAGQASIDKVAGPVGEALIMTAIGLGVAVPAVLGYNFLVRRNKSALEKVRAFGSDLHSVLIGGAAKTGKKG